MEQNSIALINYFSGGIAFTFLTFSMLFLWKKKEIHASVILAGLISTIWLFSLTANYYQYTLARQNLLLLETLRYGAWISAILLSLPFTLGHPLQARFRYIIHSIWISSFILILSLVISQHPLVSNTNLLIWNNLILAIVGLVAVEQLLRNTNEQRMTKLLSVCVGALLSYDIYLFSYSLIFDQIDIYLWHTRGAVNGIVALALTAGAMLIFNQKGRRTALAVSRPVVFYTTSMSVAGVFLAVISIGGYYVKIYGGAWGNIIQVAGLFLALAALSVVFTSFTARSVINVWINKHFFRHKYDYRVEWLRLINSLTQPSIDEEFHAKAIHVVASIFKSPGGCLWLEHNEEYHPVQCYQSPLPIDAIENKNSDFCRTMLREEWVFSPHIVDAEKNQQLPAWIGNIPDVWLVLPLLTETRLLGFVVLTEPPHDSSLTWEDLDLLKTVGRQVASYLDRHDAAEQLAESKQFEAFNKLTAYIMHDLKNLIAQQGLVVENAAKHKDNPEFVEDAIRTIDNSVNRMRNLLRRLQQKETSEIKNLELHRVLMDAVKKCQENKPTPSLRFEDTNAMVDADQDMLIMTIANIIQNAQEATSNTGFIDVTLRQEDKDAIITIEDNGEGMDEEFIRERLFKPFETTKSGKGMGIGVYQTKEFIADLGGQVTVNSRLDEGTRFTLSIPLSTG